MALLATSGTLLLGAVTAQPALAPSGEGFTVGFSEDLPRAIGPEAVTPARDLGAKSFRFTLQWSPGQTRIAESDVVDLQDAVSDASGMTVVLAVYSFGANAPQTDFGRGEFCAYVRDALTRLPSVRDVVIWNEPNKSLFWSPQPAANGASAAPVAYEALLARCYDLLHAAFSDVNVIGLALSPTGNDDAGSHSPGAFIRSVGEAYRASGRDRPLFDTVAHHVYGITASERPWRKHIGSKVLSQGDWNKLMYNLWLAFDGTAQPIPGAGGVGIWYMEGGSQTAIDAGKETAYSGAENVAVVPDYVGGEPETPPPADTSAAPDQYTQVQDSIRLAACQPYVGAYFNFLLFDEPRLAGWQSGAYWADRTPKDSLPGFREAISDANTAAVDCDALKGGRPSVDFMPPSTPEPVSAAALETPLRVELTWGASSDDLSSVGYRVYRNGVHAGTTSGTTSVDTAVAPATAYTYTVRGLDSAGNLGGASAPVTVTTPAGGSPPPPLLAPPAAPPPPPADPPLASPPASPPAPQAQSAQPLTRTGTARRDVLRGTPGPDVLRGLGGADVLYGLAGNDILFGGRGRDRLLAGSGGDVVQAADGARDIIVCGPGRDRVFADRVDRIARDCELVQRRT
jgi:hypothetical protein